MSKENLAFSSSFSQTDNATISKVIRITIASLHAFSPHAYEKTHMK